MKRNYFDLFLLNADSLDVAHYATLHRENLDGLDHETIEKGIDLPAPLSSSLVNKIVELVNTSAEPVKASITNNDRPLYLNGGCDNSEEYISLTFRRGWPEETAVNIATIQRNLGDVRTGRRCVSIVVEWITD